MFQWNLLMCFGVSAEYRISEMCFKIHDNIDVLWCFSGQPFSSCGIQSPGSHQCDAMTIVTIIVITHLHHHLIIADFIIVIANIFHFSCNL